MTEHPQFTLDVHQNEYLPAGATDVHAVLSVKATGASGLAASGGHAAQVIIIDTSTSMVGSKMDEARAAARTAVKSLRDGASFAIISGTSSARQVFPAKRGATARASTATRAKAITAINQLRAGGGTMFGPWLRMAADLLRPHQDAVRHAIMLTDGQASIGDNDLTYCSGVFTCDSLGVGEDWNPNQLRRISQSLLGTFDYIRSPADLSAYFHSLTEKAMGKVVPEVALRVTTPTTVTLRMVKQVYPTELDLTGRRSEAGPRTGDYPTASWGDEEREYYVWVEVPPGAVNERVRAAQVRVVLPGDGTELARGALFAQWTDDIAQTTRRVAEVEHHTGQMEQNTLIREGLGALQSGDTATATLKLGRARKMAEESGRADIARALDQVIDYDSGTGTARVRGGVSRADQLALDAGTDRTTRLGPGGADTGSAN